jgi:hypothetical protein
MIAIRVGPAVLGDPHRGHVEVPQMVWTRHLELAGTATSLRAATVLDEVVLSHHPKDPLAVDRALEQARHDRRDHAVAVGAVVIVVADLDDLVLDRAGDL